jgi:MOSC domain-containing protein YiiM
MVSDSSPQGRLVAVCRVHALREAPDGKGATAIDKRAVPGPVEVRELGVTGDVQVDRRYHGGPERAVYAYAQESADVWARELGRPLPPGAFGENLRTAGLEVDGAEIGERWLVGDQVVVEATAPRTPCRTFAHFIEERRWVRRFTERGLPGAYLRVVQGGTVQEGDPVRVLDRPGHGVSVGAWFARRDPSDARSLLKSAEGGRLELASMLRKHVERAAARS